MSRAPDALPRALEILERLEPGAPERVKGNLDAFSPALAEFVRHLGVATSIIFGGVSAASVAGVPLASYIGSVAGWSSAFFAIAVLSICVAIACLATVPSLPGQKGVNVGTLVRILRKRRFQRISTVTILSITAHFIAFTFIEPYMRGIVGVTPAMIAILLFVFGAAGLVANVVCGALIDARLKQMVMSALVVSALSLAGLSLPVTTTLPILVGVLLFAWGGGVAVVLVGLQTWTIKEAGADALPASAIYVALFNAAIGLGAVAGSAILTLSGLATLFTVASLMTAGSIAVLVTLHAPRTRGVEAAGVGFKGQRRGPP